MSGILQSITDTILKPFRSLTGGEVHPPSSLAVAHAFIQDFQLTYCTEDADATAYPPFSPTKWDDVLRASKRDGKFVLIYLHSSLHDDTELFCEEALKDSNVLEFMHSGQALVWGADVKHRDGTEVAGYLKACAYPFMAVCMKHQSGALLVLDRIEGVSSLGNDESTTLGDKLLQRLQSVVTANQQVVTQVQEVNRAETQRRTFRQEQDEAFQDGLRQDRERVRCVCDWVVVGARECNVHCVLVMVFFYCVLKKNLLWLSCCFFNATNCFPHPRSPSDNNKKPPNNWHGTSKQKVHVFKKSLKRKQHWKKQWSYRDN